MPHITSIGINLLEKLFNMENSSTSQITSQMALRHGSVPWKSSIQLSHRDLACPLPGSALAKGAAIRNEAWDPTQTPDKEPGHLTVAPELILLVHRGPSTSNLSLPLLPLSPPIVFYSESPGTDHILSYWIVQYIWFPVSDLKLLDDNDSYSVSGRR